MSKKSREELREMMHQLLLEIKRLREEFLSCDDCEKYTPDMFMVSDKEWDLVVGKENHKMYLCEKCYDARRINKKIVAGKRRQIYQGVEI